MKKFASLIVCVLLIAMIAGCSNGGSAVTPSPSAAAPSASAVSSTAASSAPEAPVGGKLFEEPTTISMLITEHPNFLYNADSYLAELLLENYNVKLDVTAIQDGFIDRVNLDIVSGTLPDLVAMTSQPDIYRLGLQGVFIDYMQYMDSMPNYTEWVSDYKSYEKNYLASDGQLFVMPNLGYGQAGNPTFWLYRKDVFEKNGIAPPKTDAEFYEACKQLKELYPDSYPFAMREIINGGTIARIAYQWNSAHNMYYNDRYNEWRFASTEDSYKEMLMFLNKLYTEGLMPPNILTLDVKGWQDLMSNDQMFITNDYIARIDFFNTPMRQQNPDFNLAYVSPFKGGDDGRDKYYNQTTQQIQGLATSSSSKQIDTVIKYLDNMYREEVRDLYVWGEEGVSYEVRSDGKKYHIGITEGYIETINKYGFFQRGHYTVFDPWAMLNTGSSGYIEAYETGKSDAGALFPPGVPFTSAEDEQRVAIEPNITAASDENVSKFINGSRSFDEWDKHIAELEALGIRDLINLYNTSYQSFLAKSK